MKIIFSLLIVEDQIFKDCKRLHTTMYKNNSGLIAKTKESKYKKVWV
jgi:hypothetical protein